MSINLDSIYFYWAKSKYSEWKSYFFLAIILSFTWVMIAKDYYYYNHNFVSIMGMNLFPLVGWATGLFILYIAFIAYNPYYENTSFLTRIILFTIFYWFVLIGAEFVGYHLLNIKNLATASYMGFPMCDCLHAPTWMKTAYLSMGPLFFLICSIVNVDYPKRNRESSRINING